LRVLAYDLRYPERALDADYRRLQVVSPLVWSGERCSHAISELLFGPFIVAPYGGQRIIIDHHPFKS